MGSYPYHDEPTHTTGTVAAAARDTSTSATEGRLVVDAVDKVFLLEVNKHPLVTLLTNVGRVYDGKSWTGSALRKASTFNPSFDCFEDKYGGRYAKVSGTYTTGADTITVTGAGSSSAYIFTVGDIFLNYRTGERMKVATVPTATTITVAAVGRGFGSTAEAAGLDGDSLYIIGNVSAENGSARNINTTQSTKATNYTQIFKTTIGASGTEKEAKLYGPKDLVYQRAKKATEHALDIERAFWFGEKESVTVDSHPQRATGGIEEFINSGGSYVQDQGGALTAPDLNTFLREGFTYGEGTKMLFAGGKVLQAINEIARGQLNTVVGSKTYGVKISEWQSAFGNINIVHNPLFVQDYAGYAFLLDMDCFRYRNMNNRDTKLMTNIQSPDVDGQLDQYITEAGLERNSAAKCALLKNVEA